MLAKYYWELIEAIKNGDQLYKGIILDETDDYLPAIKAADVLISGYDPLAEIPKNRLVKHV
jgi:hypothetical protein